LTDARQKGRQQDRIYRIGGHWNSRQEASAAAKALADRQKRISLFCTAILRGNLLFLSVSLPDLESVVDSLNYIYTLNIQSSNDFI